MGMVVKVTDDSVVIETSSEKTKMEFLKSAIHTVVTKSDEKCDEVEENKEA